MAKFTYNDIVRVRERASSRAGLRAWVIAVFADRQARPGATLQAFPEGPVYTVEFEDGSTAEMHEGWLEAEQ